MRKQFITGGGVRSTTAKWYDGVTTFSDPSDINRCLDEAGFGSIRYALETVHDSEGRELTRDRKVVLERFNGNDWVSDTTRNVYYKNWQVLQATGKNHIKTLAHDNYQKIVGGDYKLHQPEDVFRVVHSSAEKLGLELAQAGIVNDGRRLFARIDLGQDIKIRDAVIPQFLLTITGIGISTRAGLSAHDMACLNEWQSMLNQVKARGIASHSHSNRLPSENMLGEFVKVAIANVERQRANIERLVNASLSQSQLDEMIQECLLDVRSDDPELVEKARHDEKAQKKLLKNVRYFEQYRDAARSAPAFIECEARGTADRMTAYGGFQSVIWIADRLRTRNALQSNLEGNMRDRKQKALTMALNFARAA